MAAPHSISAVLLGTARWHIERGDFAAVLGALPDESVHTIVTSPPYWGLRDYGTEGQLGLEATPGAFVERLVVGLREARRVLRDDGTLWLNLGDSYASTGGHTDTAVNDRRGAYNIGNRPSETREFRQRPTVRASSRRDGASCVPSTRLGAPSLKNKDMAGVPWRVALALQEDGWYLRMDCVWHKPNAMPESVTDRPAKAHEYVFLLSKSERYYYDAEAVKEPVSGTSHARGGGVHPKGAKPGSGIKMNRSFSAAVAGLVGTRNLRSVWSIPTQPVEDAHFATFPPQLAETCILAGTSEHGCCAKCGAPWERLLGEPLGDLSRPTIGWDPTCECDAPTVPCVVLDPFCGSGTTGLVALRHGRHFLGIDLSPEYVEMALRRVEGDAPLFNRGGRAL